MNWMAGTSRGLYCQYVAEGLKVYEKMLVAMVLPLLRKMSFSDGAIVWMLVNGACPGSYPEMGTYGFSGIPRLHCCLF